MWKYLSFAGIIVIVVGALIFSLMMVSLSMYFPFRGRVVPKLLPSLPKVIEPEKKRLPIREYGPGLWATGGIAEDKHRKEMGVENTNKPSIEKE